MSVITVLGLKKAGDLEVIAPHANILIDEGCLLNILISCDVCLKILLHRYGGWGYDHILTHIVPMMLEEGITRKQIGVILRENPRNFLDVESAIF